MTVFGVHTGLQNTTIDELVDLWQQIESMGFGWISIWDHFYAADLSGNPHCLEAVAAHAALACETERVTVGSLVYSIGYRHPAVLAKAITTIDLLSKGRAAMGIGAGWAQLEYDAYGIPFPPVKVRMDQLEEGIQCMRGLLNDEKTTFKGEWFQLDDAQNVPRPVNGSIPIWVGGSGEKRTLRIAARYADGWNGPFLSPEAFIAKRDILHRHCEDAGRDPKEIKCAVNLGLCWREEDFELQFGKLRMAVAGGVLQGSDEEVRDRVGQYVDAGVDQINIALRAPWDPDALARLAQVVSIS